MRAVRWLHRDEAYRRRERLTVTVTRCYNARNAPPLYQFRFAAPGRSRPERRSRGEFQEKRPHTPPNANEKRLSSRRTQIWGLLRICTVHYAVSTAIFSRCPPSPGIVLSRQQSEANVLSSGYRPRGERDRVKLVSTSCGSLPAQDRICMETNRLLLRLASERVCWCKLRDYIIF